MSDALPPAALIWGDVAKENLFRNNATVEVELPLEIASLRTRRAARGCAFRDLSIVGSLADTPSGDLALHPRRRVVNATAFDNPATPDGFHDHPGPVRRATAGCGPVVDCLVVELKLAPGNADDDRRAVDLDPVFPLPRSRILSVCF